MRRFDILDRHQDLSRSTLVEASAGTGKTFAIEHLVMRLLLEGLSIHQIVVVTFTRASTRDLRLRIRKCLTRSLDILRKGLIEPNTPDYLKQVLENKGSFQSLEEASNQFEEAQILTIHAFCARMLREYLNEECDEEQTITPIEIKEVIRDFLRTELRQNLYTSDQIQMLSQAHGHSLEKLENTIYKLIQSGSISAPPQPQSIQELLAHIAQGCQQMLARYLDERSSFDYDAILLKMLQEVQTNPKCSQAIRARFPVAIVDEFQDTDPIQWKILSTLFLPNRLFLVGDPKQSIYAFRQADIYTYLKALRDLGQESHAFLDTNFRSTQALVDALNAFFMLAPEMKLPKTGEVLRYHPVKAGKGIPNHVLGDTHGSIHFGIAKNDLAHKLSQEHFEENYFYPFFVREIHHLKNHISLNQCAVLVKDRYQAQRLSSYFESQNIPTFNQRSRTIVESPVLASLQDLFSAVERPHDPSAVKAAVGGLLVGGSHDCLQQLADANSLALYIHIFKELHQILHEKGIARFFAHLLAQSWPHSGDTIVKNLLKMPSGIILHDDLQFLIDLILTKKPDSALQFLDFISLFGEGEDQFQRRIAAPQEAVQIITMHASKGLEFEVVFALGLIVRTKAPELFVPTPDENGFIHLEPVVDPSSMIYQNHCDEMDAEKMRQLYVAMTRAKQRLYVPIVIDPIAKPPERGCASPLEIFSNHLEKPLEHTLEELSKKHSITYEFLSQTAQNPLNSPQKKPIILKAPPSISIPQKQEQFFSFSSLAHPQHAGLSPPVNFQEAAKTIHTLPSSRELGTLLHLIMEKLHFSSAPANLSSLIEPYLAHTPFTTWSAPITELIDNALHVQLPAIDGTTFSLRDIPDTHYYKEMTFLYPSSQEQFMQGVIDLIFRYKEHYYILDWKSNWLGPSQKAYSQENLAKAMQENDYFLQAKLYTTALRNYLARIDQRPFEEIFGGTFYLFLRGLGRETSHGIYKV